MTSIAETATAATDTNRAVSRLNADSLSWTIVRVATGAMLMPHGGHGLAGTGHFFQSLGLAPGLLFGGAAGLTEFFGGLFLVLGLLTRVSAAAVVALMAYAAFVVHLGNGFFWTSGGLEYPLLWGLIALAILIRGGGEFSLDHRIGWRY